MRLQIQPWQEQGSPERQKKGIPFLLLFPAPPALSLSEVELKRNVLVQDLDMLFHRSLHSPHQSSLFVMGHLAVRI